MTSLKLDLPCRLIDSFHEANNSIDCYSSQVSVTELVKKFGYRLPLIDYYLDKEFLDFSVKILPAEYQLGYFQIELGISFGLNQLRRKTILLVIDYLSCKPTMIETSQYIRSDRILVVIIVLEYQLGHLFFSLFENKKLAVINGTDNGQVNPAPRERLAKGSYQPSS